MTYHGLYSEETALSEYVTIFIPIGPNTRKLLCQVTFLTVFADDISYSLLN